MANHEPSATSQTPEFGPLNVRLEVQDFGPVAQGSVQLRPLTVFVGPSNTGKTYLSLLIYALNDVFEGFSRLPLYYGRDRTIGSYINFVNRPSSHYRRALEIPGKIHEETEEIFDKLTKNKHIQFSELPVFIRDELESNINNSELFGSDLLSEIQRCFDIESQSELIHWPSSKRFKVSLSVSDLSGDLWQFTMNVYPDRISVRGHLKDILLQRGVQRTNNQRKKMISDIESFRTCTQLKIVSPVDLQQFLLRLLSDPELRENKWTNSAFYLPAVRGGIMQSHRIIASALVGRATRAGFERIPQTPTLSGGVADFMQTLILYDECQRNSIPAASEQIASLAKDLEKEILSGDILVDQSTPGGYPEFVYCPQGTQQNIRLSRASSMVSELTPIVLLMRGRLKPGDTLIIEEPEAHLHPAAQTQMARTLAALVRAGVRVVVTTHSDWLLQEMANLVREGELRQAQEKDSEPDASSPWLTPEELGVWLFKDSQDGGGATVKEIPFDRVDGLEPEDYANVAETLYNDSAKLQNQLEMIKSQGGVAK